MPPPSRPLFPGAIRFLAGLAALAILLLLAAILFHLWKVTMPKLIRLIQAACALALLAAVFLMPYFAQFHPLATWLAFCAVLLVVALAIAWLCFRPALTWVAISVAAFGMSGCAGVGKFLTTTQADDTVGARILNDIQGCKRTYGGSLGPAGIQGSFNISCDPQPAPAVIPLSKFGTPGATPAEPPQ